MNLTFFILTNLFMVANLCWIIFFTPMVPDQEWAQKIFYLHVPIAWSGFLAYFIVMINGFLYLFSKDLKYDRIGHASAEIGTIFTSLVLITGPIWATPIWGKPWVWEPRLVTTLVLFLIYIGYFILRNIGLYRQRAALVSAIIGIIAFLDIPIIFASVNFWAAEIQSHPQLGMNKQPSGILNPFLFSLVSFTSLMILMLMLKIEVLKKKDIEDRYV
jgi:heme exporter protein C